MLLLLIARRALLALIQVVALVALSLVVAVDGDIVVVVVVVVVLVVDIERLALLLVVVGVFGGRLKVLGILVDLLARYDLERLRALALVASHEAILLLAEAGARALLLDELDDVLAEYLRGVVHARYDLRYVLHNVLLGLLEVLVLRVEHERRRRRRRRRRRSHIDHVGRLQLFAQLAITRRGAESSGCGVGSSSSSSCSGRSGQLLLLGVQVLALFEYVLVERLVEHHVLADDEVDLLLPRIDEPRPCALHGHVAAVVALPLVDDVILALASIKYYFFGLKRNNNKIILFCCCSIILFSTSSIYLLSK